jgi:hypothetical protein
VAPAYAPWVVKALAALYVGSIACLVLVIYYILLIRLF